MVHTDLKPENILFLDDEIIETPQPAGSRLATRLPRHPSVRLIDFGSATFDEDYHSSVVSTRHYRAPEIILGLGWSHPCDMWSLGCILVELLTGDALFQTHENMEHLAMMEAVLGPMTRGVATAAAASQNQAVRGLFKRGAVINWPEGAEGKRSLRAVAKIRPLAETLRSGADASVAPHVPLIVDLISRMMEWEPDRRITAREALRHPFFAADIAE
jgi:dual-specificity kinase